MPVEPQNERVIRFGVFEADLMTRELRKRGVRVRLQEQPFRLLQALLERPGQIVTREEIKDRLWPDDTFVDFDKSLNTAAQKLRQALGDSAESPRFLETIPRQGYRFLVQAEAAGGQADAAPEAAAQSEEAKTGAPLWQRLAPWALSGLLALGLGWTLLSRPDTGDDQRPVRQFTIVPEVAGAGVFSVASRTGNTPAAASISPDGRWIAYFSSEEPPRIWLHDLESGQARPIEATNFSIDDLWNAGRPQVGWSPDSSSLAILTRSSLKRFNLRDGSLTVLHTLEKLTDNYWGVCWSPTGASIFFAYGEGLGGASLYALPAAGGDATQIENRHGHAVRNPLALPGHEKTLVVNAGEDLHLLDMATGTVTLLIEDANSAVLSPSGHFVFNRRGSIWAVDFDLESLELAGEPFLVMSGFTSAGISREGALLAVTSRVVGDAYQLQVRDGQGGVLRAVSAPLFDVNGISVSPRGDRVAVSAASRPGLSRDIQVFRLEGGQSSLLTGGGQTDDHPIWTPDGSHILFRRYEGVREDADFYLVDASVGGAAQSFLDTDARVGEADFSPGGETLLFQSAKLGGFQFDIHMAEISDAGEAGQPRPWVEGDGFQGHPQFSPDGRFVAYASTKSGSPQLSVAPFPAGSPIWPASTVGGNSPRWSPDGRTLFWRQGREDGSLVLAASVDFGRANPIGPTEELFEILSKRLYSFDVLPDGRFVVAELLEEEAALADIPVRMRLVENWYEEFRDPGQ